MRCALRAHKGRRDASGLSQDLTEKRGTVGNDHETQVGGHMGTIDADQVALHLKQSRDP